VTWQTIAEAGGDEKRERAIKARASYRRQYEGCGPTHGPRDLKKGVLFGRGVGKRSGGGCSNEPVGKKGGNSNALGKERRGEKEDEKKRGSNGKGGVSDGRTPSSSCSDSESSAPRICECMLARSDRAALI